MIYCLSKNVLLKQGAHSTMKHPSPPETGSPFHHEAPLSFINKVPLSLFYFSC